jgi:hypothetical protein
MLHAAGPLIFGALGGLLVATAAFGAEPVENFPSRPIHIVLPFTPGGGTDVIARKLAPGMQQRLGQPVVIENRPGGNARIGANLVAKAEPDGYTILLTTNGAFVIAPFIGGKPTILEDFAPVTFVARSPCRRRRTRVPMVDCRSAGARQTRACKATYVQRRRCRRILPPNWSWVAGLTADDSHAGTGDVNDGCEGSGHSVGARPRLR